MANNDSSSSLPPRHRKPFPASSRPISLSPSKRNGPASSATKISRANSPFKRTSPEPARGLRIRIDLEKLRKDKKLPSVSALVAKFETQAKSSTGSTPTRGTTGQAVAIPTPAHAGNTPNPPTSSASLRIRLPHFRIAQSPRKRATVSIRETDKENAPLDLSESSEDVLEESSDESDTPVTHSSTASEETCDWDAKRLETSVDAAFRWVTEEASQSAIGGHITSSDFVSLLQEGLRR